MLLQELTRPELAGYHANISAMQHIDMFDITAPQLFLHTLSIWMDGMDKELKEMYTQMLEERCLKVQVYSSPPTPFWRWNGGYGCVCHNRTVMLTSRCAGPGVWLWGSIWISLSRSLLLFFTQQFLSLFIWTDEYNTMNILEERLSEKILAFPHD